MKKEKNTWHSLLLRWLSGEATRKDEHALDTLAQEDSFLADAVEGYRSMPAENHLEAITKLKAKLRHRYKKQQKGMAFYLLRAAAAGVIVVAAWAVVQLFVKPEKESARISEAIPRQENQISTSPPEAPAETTAISPNSNISLDKVPPESAQPTMGITSKQATPQGNSNPAAAPGKASEAENRVASVSAETEDDVEQHPGEDSASMVAKNTEETFDILPGNKETMPPAEPVRTAPASGDTDTAAKKSTGATTVYGKVTDASGEPLIGASLLIKGTNKGTVTGIDGTFQLPATGETPTLVISYTGYKPQEVVVKNQAFVEVKMQENAEALSEVVVSGLGKRKLKAENAKADNSNPEPEGGFKKLQKHILENLRYPEQAALNKSEGKVTLRFSIQPDGTPTDFTVLETPGYGCTEEAQRLLREGPKWKAQPGNFATYTIEFRLKE